MKAPVHVIRAVISVVILFSTAAGYSQATAIEVSGDITGNTIWSADTVKVTGDITVRDSITLIINPGTYIEFQGPFSIHVRGTLVAVGTSSENIVFTINDTTEHHIIDSESGGWDAIIFNNSFNWGGAEGAMSDNDSSILEHCILEYSKCSDRYSALDGGAIRVTDFSRLKILNCTFRYNSSAAWGGAMSLMRDADILVKNCSIIHNIADVGGGISIAVASALILNNYIANNSLLQDEKGNVGGGIFCYTDKSEIRGNIIIHNHAFSGGGIAGSSSEAQITGNTIAYNTTTDEEESFGGGLMIYKQSRPHVARNIIVNNSAHTGGGIRIQNSDPLITSNLIANNHADWTGGGIDFFRSDAVLNNNSIINNFTYNYGGAINVLETNAILRNCLIWGNTASGGGTQYNQSDAYSKPEFYFCNIEGGLEDFGGELFHGTYENNLSTDPLLTNPSSSSDTTEDALISDFSLNQDSPCINAGDKTAVPDAQSQADLAGNPRVSHNKIDIGAYEAHIPFIECSDTIRDHRVWIADTVYVTGNICIIDSASLKITPGIFVQFKGHFKMDVQGMLSAIGTEDNKIHFTVMDTLGFHDVYTGDGGWKGIHFNNGGLGAQGAMFDNDSSKLIHCIFKYGNGLDAVNDSAGGALFIHYFDKVRIEKCEFANNQSYKSGGAINCLSASPLIRNNYFHHNKSHIQGGGAITCAFSGPLIENNLFRYNWAGNHAGAINLYYSDPVIQNNTIEHNSCETSGGAIYGNLSPARVLNNRILNNSAATGGAISLVRQPVELLNNLIANNTSTYSGGGIYLYIVEDLKIINNTIVSNRGKKGGALRTYISSVQCFNSVIWNNKAEMGNQVFISSSASEVDFLNCNIQGGKEDFYIETGEKWPGEYLDNIDTLPEFINPTDSVGAGFDASEADFSLHPTSSCINSGLVSLPDYNLPAMDLGGNSRIHGGFVDMGAFENHSDGPSVVIQPLNQVLCQGEQVAFSIRTEEKSNFQWQKDEVDIPDATGASLVIDSVTAEDDGNYQCIISDMHDTIRSNSAYLLVKNPASVLVEPANSWIREDESFLLRMIPNGSMPFDYQWQKDGIDVPEANSPEYLISEAGLEDEGEYQCIISNYCATDTTRPVSVFLAPQICMVTVSQTTGHNLVVWEKGSIAPILAYNIYRESEAAGIYDLLATVPYEDLSVFVDTVADPTIQAYLYKITAADTSEVETDIDLCKPHKTVHLIVSTNPELNTTQLQWDRYYGFDYNTYTIYKSITGLNFDPVHSMSASLNSWTDPEPSTDDLFYRIAVEKPVPCVPEGTGRKAGSGPFVHSLSNMDDNKLKEGQMPPDTIILSNDWIHESTKPGTVIGKLISSDPDSLDSFTYKFAPGDGDDDNLSFTLLGDLLLSSMPFDYSNQQSFKIRIRSTDEAGNFCEVPFVLNIIPTGMKNYMQGDMRVIPNPFSQYTTISFPNPEGGSFNLILTDLSGKVCRIENNIRTNEFVLKKQYLKGGVYFIELTGPRTFRTRILIE